MQTVQLENSNSVTWTLEAASLNNVAYSLPSKRFCAVYEQRKRNESQRPREKWPK